MSGHYGQGGRGVRGERVGDVMVVRLDRAEKRNALTPEMLSALLDAISESKTDGARALVLSGVGEVFCAGFDLSLCRENSEALSVLLSGLSKVIVALRELPCGVVISAHGAAIAGGCALLGGADVVVTTADAKLGYPVVRLGISPGVSAPFLMPMVGNGAARARLLDSGLINGREAMRIGMASECVEEGPNAAGVCEARALVLARDLASKPPGAFAATKEWLKRVSPVSGAEEALRVSLDLVGSEEERERLEGLWRKA